MIKDITITNFKSITETSLSLGNVNVFIGANGSGKSNILEAVAMVASERSLQIEVKDMIQKGVRIAKPELMISSFYGQRANEKIGLRILSSIGGAVNYNIWNNNPNDIYMQLGIVL